MKCCTWCCAFSSNMHEHVSKNCRFYKRKATLGSSLIWSSHTVDNVTIRRNFNGSCFTIDNYGEKNESKWNGMQKQAVTRKRLKQKSLNRVLIATYRCWFNLVRKCTRWKTHFTCGPDLQPFRATFS